MALIPWSSTTIVLRVIPPMGNSVATVAQRIPAVRSPAVSAASQNLAQTLQNVLLPLVLVLVP